MSMKPDAYMPFYGDDFFTAIEMLPDEVGLIYLRCIWHYWKHNHCKGFVHDDAALLKLCRNNQQAKDIIFQNGGPFFSQDEEFLWRQKRTDEIWEKVSSIYERNVLGGQMTAKKRWGIKPKMPSLIKPSK